MLVNGGSWKLIAYGAPVFAYMYTFGSVGYWLPLYAKIHGFTYFEVQFLSTIYYGVIAPSTLIAGWLSDRSGSPGRIAFMGMVLSGIATLLMPSLLKPVSLIGVRAFQAIGLSTAVPVALGALSLTFGISVGVGAGAVIMAIGMATGSIFSGILVEYLGFPALFYTTALINFVAGILALTTDFPTVEGGISLLMALKEIPVSVWIALLGIFGRNLFSTGIFAITSILFNKIIGITIVETGIALALNPIFTALISIKASKISKQRELTVYSVSLGATGIVFLLYYLAKSLPTILLAQSILGIDYALISVSGNMYAIKKSPHTIRYTASSLFNLFFNLGWIAGTIIAGIYMTMHNPLSWLKISITFLPFVGIFTFVVAKRVE